MYKKIAQGRTYWYLRETYRDQGKVKLKWQKYLGTAEAIMKKLQEKEEAGKPEKTYSQAFGALFLAHVIEKELNTISLIEGIIPRKGNEKGPSVGEYFFFAWVNRMIAPKSKRGLREWYSKTAIQHIHPVDLGELSSERYWEKWNRVTEEHVEKIAKGFFARVWDKQGISPEVILFDTTNYFTYMAAQTESELARKGHNKASKHHLRQIGVGVLQDRASSLPVHYSTYPGNMHDSRLFNNLMDEIFGILAGFTDNEKHLTVVFDKGMNSSENISYIDDHEHVHFLTTYSPYLAEYEARKDPSVFKTLDIPKNHELKSQDKENDCLRAYRTTIDIWGKPRTMVVTYNPATQRKKIYTLDGKLERVRNELLEFRRKYNNQEPKWRSEQTIRTRYKKVCENLYISHKYYDLSFNSRRMRFRKNHQEISIAKTLMGKNLIVTDNSSWSTEDIVQASLDRYKVEKCFRTSKDPFQVRVNPMFHWTDTKIRCHILTCIMALTVLRIIELKLKDKYTSKVIIEEMHDLDCVLTWPKGAKKPEVGLETPTEVQTEILKAMGYVIKDAWVLQQ